MHKWRIREEDKLITAAILSRLHEVLLTSTLAPIIALAIKREVRLGTTLIGLDVSPWLLQCACAEIHAPHRKANTDGIARSIYLLREEQIGNIALCYITPILPNKMAAPRIGCTEEFDGLVLHIGIYCYLLLSHHCAACEKANQ